MSNMLNENEKVTPVDVDEVEPEETDTMNEEKETPSPKEVIVASAADWLPASQMLVRFKLTRTDGSTLVFPLKGIPAVRYYAIGRETKPMDVPKKTIAQRDIRGKTVKGAMPITIDDTDDPAYVASVIAMNNKRTTLVVEAALTFQLPGKTWEEKHKWLEDRLPGDVDKLYNFIVLDLLNLGSKVGEYL